MVAETTATTDLNSAASDWIAIAIDINASSAELTIIVIGSGLYLWFARRGRKTHAAAAVPERRMALSSR